MRKHLLALSLFIGLGTNLPTYSNQTLTWGASSDALSLDPYSIYEVFTLGFLENVYEGLVRRTKDLKLEPALATKWSQTSPTTWRFELRKGVKFHGGEDFNADDVVFSFARVKGEFSDIKNSLSSIKDVKKIDDYTVEFITHAPSLILPQNLGVFYILSKKWCEANKSEAVANYKAKAENFANRNTNGTGPFKLTSRTVDVETILEAHTDWWDETKEHNLDKVIFKPIKADATRVSAVLSGEVDLMFPVPIQDEKRIEAAPNLKLIKGAELRTIMFQLNQKDAELKTSSLKGINPLKDKRVREAMYKAIDSKTLHEKIMRGHSNPAALIFGPQIGGFDASLNTRYDYSVEEAQKLMKEAGFEKGFDITLDCPNDRYVADESICTAVAPMLAKIGVKVTPRIQSKAKFFPLMLSRSADFYLFGWTAMNYDGSDPLKQVLATPSNDLGRFNFGSYSNAKLDDLLSKIDRELNETKRNALIGEALKLTKEDFAILPLHQQMLLWAHKKDIDVTQRADEVLSLRFIKKH